MQNTLVQNKRLSPEQTKEEMIQYILENFDFHTCRKVMNYLDWKWYGRVVPTIGMLKDAARYQLECAISGCLDKKENKSHHSPYFCSSGGLKATAMRDKYGRLEFVELEFILSEWNCDGDDIDELNKKLQDIYS